MVAFLALIPLLLVADAHICVWQPRQRGAFNIDKPDSDSCYRKVGPCGGIRATSTSRRTKLQANTAYTVKFQQNMNHYYTNNPGRMDVSFAVGENPREEQFQVLKSISDFNPMNQITQTNFSLDILLPNISCKTCVLRVRYLSQNPLEDDRGTTFYQCADIELTTKRVKENEKIVREAEKRLLLEPDNKLDTNRKTNPNDCCAPASFVVVFVHRIPKFDFHSSGLIYYDKPSQKMHVKITSGSGQLGIIPNGEYAMWMDFPLGLQYYQNINKNTCYSFGLDFFNEWCFGNTYNQSENFVAKDAPCTSHIGTCNQWRNGDFLYEAFSDTCYPASVSRKLNGERTDFYAALSGPFDEAIFQPDPTCLN